MNGSRIQVLSSISSAWLAALTLALGLVAASGARAAQAPTAPAATASTAAATPSTAPRPSAPATSEARSPGDGEVSEHLAQGGRLYLLGRYQEAIAEFRRAYELRADPRSLYQIAESYRQLGAIDQALFYYDRYLTDEPEAADRSSVEEKVADLETERGRSTSAALVGEAPPASPVSGAGQPGRRPRAWQTWWFWTVVGAAVVAGVTAGALFSRSETSIPSSDLGDKKFF